MLLAGSLASSLIFAAHAGVGGLAYASDVVIEGEAAGLSDIAELGALPVELQVKAAEVVLLRFRPGQTRISASRTQLSERARGLMPALAPFLPDGPELVNISQRRIDTAGAQRDCQVVLAPIPAGRHVLASEVADAPCAGGAPMTLTFAGDTPYLRASRDLAPGDNILARPAGAYAVVRPGQELHLRTRVGAVHIERSVTALQAAGSGEKLFVSSANGQVMTMVAEPAQ